VVAPADGVTFPGLVHRWLEEGRVVHAALVADVGRVGHDHEQAGVTGLEGVPEAVHEGRLAFDDRPLGEHHGRSTGGEMRP
jgi:hypothetical protein